MNFTVLLNREYFISSAPCMHLATVLEKLYILTEEKRKTFTSNTIARVLRAQLQLCLSRCEKKQGNWKCYTQRNTYDVFLFSFYSLQEQNTAVDVLWTLPLCLSLIPAGLAYFVYIYTIFESPILHNPSIYAAISNFLQYFHSTHHFSKFTHLLNLFHTPIPIIQCLHAPVLKITFTHNSILPYFSMYLLSFFHTDILQYVSTLILPYSHTSVCIYSHSSILTT